MANLIEKDLGAVSAYAYAVEQGYKGTEEQFAKEQAGFAQNAQQVATDKDTVVNAVNGFDQKVTDANNVITKAIEDIDTAKTGAVGAVTAEGAAQVNAVKQEGTTQKKVVDDAVNGIVADRAQIEQNKNDILSLSDNFIIKRNYFDKKIAKLKTFITGEIKQHYIEKPHDSLNSILLPVDYGKTYVLMRTDFIVLQIDENGIVLSRDNPNTETHFRKYTITNPKTKYIGISWVNIPIDEYMILDEGESFDEYIPYPMIKKLASDIIITQKKNVYTVGKNGDFKTFTGMLRALKDDNTNKTVYIESGVYDIFEEMGGVEFMSKVDASSNWREVCEVVPPNTKIIGIGDVTLKFTPTKEQITPEKSFLFSPLNLTGSCHIENISIIGENCRYAIHDESSNMPQGEKAIQEFVNVRCFRGVGDLNIGRSAFGAGIGGNAKWSFTNCIFESESDNVWTVHTNGPYDITSASVMFNGCKFICTKSPDYVLLVFTSAYLPQKTHNFVKIISSYVGGKIKTAVNKSMHQSFDVDVIATKHKGVVNALDAISGYTINDYGN